jgi:hypothetical protein
MLEDEWNKALASNPNGACLEARWKKASASQGASNCLEARWQSATASASGASLEARLDGMVEIRDSKHPDGPVVKITPEGWVMFLKGALAGEYGQGDLPPLEFTDAEWAAFLDGAGKGEFDLPPVEPQA